MSEQEIIMPDENQQKKYLRNYTDEGTEKQKIHLETIRKKQWKRKEN